MSGLCPPRCIQRVIGVSPMIFVLLLGASMAAELGGQAPQDPPPPVAEAPPTAPAVDNGPVY